MIGKKLCGMMLITNKERNNVATTVEIVTYLRLIKRPNTDSNLWYSFVSYGSLFSPGFASFKIKLPKVVVCVKAKTQLNPKDTANTINNGFTISATDAGAKYIGKKEHTAIKVAPNNAHCGFVAPSINA